ncbi:processed acidic surface protein [Terribacillus halophilus]|uniref:Processed acidic surface protein n=1 Tax=Terribacillus halophilus TaxID=361279 RepID=A0A1G6RNY1_9BACI|nr:processed acidic surface protein [Terribacillus halophilus]SDD06064.1 processed acidic surface protein [Terribacillus halophilus]
MTKKLVVGMIMVLLCLQAVAPQTAFAAIDVKELEAYAAELGTDAEGLKRYLVDFDWGTLEEIDAGSVEELRESLGDPVTSENFQAFLDENNYTAEQFEQRLKDQGYAEKGYTAKDVLLVTDLYYVMGEPVNAVNLQMLADDLDMTEKELADLFAENGFDLYSYVYMDDLYEMIYNDINGVSLHFLLLEVDMSKEELDQLLNDNGMTLDDFASYDELASFIYTESGYEFEMEWESVSSFLQAIGISKEEYLNFYDHLHTVLSSMDEAFFERLLALYDRLEVFSDFETINELDDSQREEIVSIWAEAMDLFQLQAKFYLVDGETKQEVTIEELSRITDIGNQILFVELYDADGNLLMDFSLTGDLVNHDIFDIPAAVEQPKPAVEQAAPKHKAPVKEKVTVTPAETATKTVKEEGKRLPDTASPVGNVLLTGAVLMAAGAVLYAWNRRKKHSN